jgi:rare lipoprotein A
VLSVLFTLTWELLTSRNAASRIRIVESFLILFREEIMRRLSFLVAVATVPAWLALHVNTAAAQNFHDRWSIIPKAHAEPAPETPDASKQTPKPQSPKDSEETAHPDGRSNMSEATPTKKRFSGKASFYSYSKGKTASGASFDRDMPTAAHRSLPFGTRVRITDVSTSKSLVVRITDRGPWVRGRVLDLSLGAARDLGIMDRGVVEVRAEVL